MKVRTQRLPIGYRELEYLESSGTQYIDTGVIPVSDYEYFVSFELKAFTKPNIALSFVFASYAVSNRYNIQARENQFYFQTGAGNSIIVQAELNKRYDFKANDNKYIINGTSYQTGTSFVSGGNGRSFQIFYDSRYGSNTQAIMKLFSSWIYNNGAKVRNFIPAERTSDSKPGLYDTINDVFYVNQGTGEFIKGPYKDGYRLNLYPRLPSIYQEVEYIESNGTQQIDTGYKFNIETESCYVDFQSTKLNHNGMILASPSAASPYFWLYYYAGSNHVDIYASNSSGAQYRIAGPHLTTTRMQAEFRNKSLYVNGTAFGSLSATTGTTARNLYLFSYGGAYYFQGKIFSAKIWDSSKALVRNFIPCYRKSDSVIGLFDTINQVFYTNQGTGTFSKGSDVNIQCMPRLNALPDAYQGVEYVEFTGTQYIDTQKTTTVGKTYIQETDIQFTSYPSTGTYYINGGDYGLYFGLRNESGSVYFVNSSGSRLSPDKAGNLNKHHFISNINTNQFENFLDIDGTRYTSSRSNAYNTSTILIGTQSATGNYFAKQKLYTYKIYEDSVLVRNFIPCYRKSDNVIGLYDTVEKQFYTNAGTGTFTKGPNKTFII